MCIMLRHPREDPPPKHQHGYAKEFQPVGSISQTQQTWNYTLIGVDSLRLYLTIDTADFAAPMIHLSTGNARLTGKFRLPVTGDATSLAVQEVQTT
ncbi:hypothetical protein J6590_052842 [Homalodisca vitripennis]|nr:hypothetical protein J6590_052842 [Homalodisca vitripennis]